ncbi:MAG: YkgJ family cysteine cluster protein [Moraxellaceae bacterium]|nr:YkgJ family cysteine cluster protein [Moraxellaceae bacterium]
MECRAGCAACCIAPSISSAIPDMTNGKPAGVPCVQLDEAGLCKIFGLPSRPKVCGSLQPSLSMCGQHREQAMSYLSELERLTS